MFAELFRSAEVDAICNLISKQALEVALKSGLDSARSRLQAQCVDIVRAYKNSGSYGAKQGQGGFQLHLPESLQLLPLYVVRTRPWGLLCFGQLWLISTFLCRCRY